MDSNNEGIQNTTQKTVKIDQKKFKISKAHLLKGRGGIKGALNDWAKQ